MNSAHIDPKAEASYWMRPVSFVGLLRVLHAIGEFVDGLTTKALNAEILRRHLYPVRTGDPSPTTLYHVRNTLLRIRAVRRSGRRYIVNSESEDVRRLLSASASSDTLSDDARDSFGELVVRQPECRAHFFDLFMPSSDYGVKTFRENGESIVWSRRAADGRRRFSALEGVNGKKELLRTSVQVKSILYGVRYWAQKELLLIDQFFREDRGSILFPVLLRGGAEVEATVGDIIRAIDQSEEWTTLSLADLAVMCCEKRHRRLDVLRAAIRQILRRYPGELILVPTSRAFATIGSKSRQREELELATYFLDSQKRYISHIKVHKSVLDKADAKQFRQAGTHSEPI